MNVVERIEAEVTRCEKAANSWRNDVTERPWDEDAHAGVAWWEVQAQCWREAAKMVRETTE